MTSHRATNDRRPRRPRRPFSTPRLVTRLVGVVAMVTASLVALAGPASAGVAVAVPPTFPSMVTVGQTGLPASLSVGNASTPPQNVGNVNVTDFRLVPSCTNFNVH